MRSSKDPNSDGFVIDLMLVIESKVNRYYFWDKTTRRRINDGDLHHTGNGAGQWRKQGCSREEGGSKTLVLLLHFFSNFY